MAKKPRRKPPKLKDQPRLVIAARLAAQYRKLRGYLPLARAVTDAYRKELVDPTWLSPGDLVITPDKLKKLATHDRTVSINMIEWEAIDAYLDHELTRCALLEFPSLVQELAQKPAATIIVPSRFGPEGPMISYWDHFSVAEIHLGVNPHATAIKINMIHVPRGQERPGAGHGEWRQQLGDLGPPLVILIGSSRSNRGTEKAFEKMFKRTRRSIGGWDRLPFYFVFKNNEPDSVPSKFSRTPAELPAKYHKLAADVRAGKGWGLIAGGKAFLSQAPVKPDSGSGNGKLEKKIHSYGVIAAQRQGKQLAVVIAGLTGPGSLVAAVALSAMAENLPPVGDPMEHAVLWGVAEATVSIEPMPDGGGPKLENFRFAIPPSLWDPKLRRPVKRDEDDDPKKGKSASAGNDKG